MSSSFIVPVVKIQNIREHPNASLLCLADVLGYQMVLPLVEDPAGTIIRKFNKDVRDEKGKRIPWDGIAEVQDVKFRPPYSDGTLVVYFPADSVLPVEWAERFGVRALLKGPDQNRVGRIRLRGEPSFGLVVALPEEDWKEGDNVAEYYGATKYEPPLRVTCGDAAKRDPLIDPFFQKFTDIENGRIFTDVFVEGEEVIFTEKIHGTNCKVGIIDGKHVAGSMEIRRSRPTTITEDHEVDCGFDSPQMKANTYWFPFTVPGVLELVETLAEGKKHHVLLYGEVYGGSVQELTYGIPKGKGLGFRAFGLTIDGRYLDWDDFVTVCQKYGVETVPVVYRGSYSMELAKKHADGKTTMGDHMREGIVAYPVKERTNPKVGRAVLKYIGTEYELSKHKERDNKDV